MKRSSILLCISLISMSACVRKSSQRSIDKEQHRQEGVIGSGEERSLIYDDQEHAFILDDMGSPFGQSASQLSNESQSLWVEDEESNDMETIYFAFNQYNISPEQMKAVKRASEQIKQELKASPESIVVIHGHSCSSAGSWKYNMILSEQRAQEVKKALIKLGIPAKRLRIMGHGFEMPRVASGTREQQAPNRRVEFTIVLPKK